MRGCVGAAGTERRNAGAEEHSPGHLGGTAEPGLPRTGLQCCSALRVLQTEENQEKPSLGKCRCAGKEELCSGRSILAESQATMFMGASSGASITRPNLTWLVWVFRKFRPKLRKPNSGLTGVCCCGCVCQVTALELMAEVCTGHHSCGFSIQQLPVFCCPKGKERSRWMQSSVGCLPNFPSGQPPSLPVPVNLHLGPLLPHRCPVSDRPHRSVSPYAPAKPSLPRLVQHETRRRRIKISQAAIQVFPTSPVPVSEISPGAKEHFCAPLEVGHSPSESPLYRRLPFPRDGASLSHNISAGGKKKKEVCCSLKKNKSLTLYETCAAVAPLTPCESVWVGR